MFSFSTDSDLVDDPLPLFLDIEELTTLTWYAHWIPISKGLCERLFKRNYPGWQWNQIIPELIKANILI